jgi:hypothetical protein
MGGRQILVKRVVPTGNGLMYWRSTANLTAYYLKEHIGKEQ